MVTLLYSLGLTLTLLFALGLLGQWLPSAAVLLALTAAVCVGAADRRLAWAVSGVGALAAVVWLLAGGAESLGEVLRALEMQINGLPTALPFVARETALLSALVCGVAGCVVTQRSAGPYPALVLLLLTVVVLWLTNMTEGLWCLLPSVIACVALMLLGDHDMSAARVLPLAVATVLLSYTAVAAGGLEIPAFREAADALRQRVYDIFFFTGVREEFSLADVGYYPQGEGQLGGPAEPSKDPVMAVVTPRKVYLRGVIRDTYTGRSWEDGTEGKRYLWDSRRYRDIRDRVFDADRPLAGGPEFGQLMSQRKVILRMLGGSASTMFMPQRVRQLSVEGGVVPYFNAGSEVFTTRNLRAGDVWEADAPVFVAGEAGVRELIQACSTKPDPDWESVNSAYRALPEHMEQEVFDLAWAAIGDAEAPYDKALVLQEYLRNEFEYTLDAPVQQEDMDFVTTFLLLNKEGYCTHFASAMTVMCRMIGLPARYVEGFVATPDEKGMAVVTGEQGHAWTEVYFSGFGWLTFDATPAGVEVVYVPPENTEEPDASSQEPVTPPPTNTPEPTEAPATPTPAPAPTPDAPTPTPQPTPENAPTSPPTAAPGQPQPIPEEEKPFPWALLAILGAAALLTALAARILWMTPGMQSRRQKTEFSRWLVWARAAHDALRQLGLERQMEETPMAFFARVDATNRIPQVLSQLSGAESLMFYGHAVPLPEETLQAKQTYEVVRAQLNPLQRLRMALQRAFLPRRSRDITVK